jgi:hypothetical protein
MSQDALRVWAASNGYYVTFLDAPSGSPRTGIVDTLLIKIGIEDPYENTPADQRHGGRHHAGLRDQLDEWVAGLSEARRLAAE